MRWKIAFPLLASLALVLVLGATASAAATRLTTGRGIAATSPLCGKLGVSLGASSGAYMACFGPQQSGSASSRVQSAPAGVPQAPFSANVDAADLSEDVINGTRAYGQSETSIAASGPYVVEAWNDATAFFAPACAAKNKDQGTGIGFSNDGGKSFTDLGGLPNASCATTIYEGDPSVEVFRRGGKTYFYVASLYVDRSTGTGSLAMDACQVSGSGSSARLSCNANPIVISRPADSSFLDKEYLAVDQARARLYVSYTDFTSTGGDNINLAVCDLGSPLSPTCHGQTGSDTAYLTIRSASGCAEEEGAYPAVGTNGDVYVGWEHNWATNLFGCNVQVQDNLAGVPFACLTLTPAAVCGPSRTISVDVTSLSAAFIPGYNRFPANDFPRLAFSSSANLVSMVWNDTRRNLLGDILLQSFRAASLAAVQSSPVRLNTDTGTGTLHFLPALRQSDSSGLLNVTWYDRRRKPNSALTDVFAALRVDPTRTSTPAWNKRVTDVASDWNANSSDIVPNFGDYTDNYVNPVSDRLYVAWSDGRLSVPQPFESHTGW